MSTSTNSQLVEPLSKILPASTAYPHDSTTSPIAQRPMSRQATVVAPYAHQDLLTEIAKTYDSAVVRSYCKARFLIINLNILHIVALCMRGKKRVLDIGCGFGLFGCYFSALHPDVTYVGYDQNAGRINMARKAAKRLGLTNANFHCGDARDLHIDEQFDAIMMLDLMHHIDNDSKRLLLEYCAQHLSDSGSLMIKDISTHSKFKTFFTWALDVLMSRGFDMWYCSERQFHELLSVHFSRIETFPLSDWLPYPHIVYLCEQPRKSQRAG